MAQKRRKLGKNNQGGRHTPTAQDLLNRPAFMGALEVEKRVSAGESYYEAREEIAQNLKISTRTLERNKLAGQAFSAMGQPMASWQTIAHALPGETNPLWHSQAYGKTSAIAPRPVSPSTVTGTDIQLLKHLKEIFDETGALKMPSADLVAALLAKANSPWNTCGKSSKPMTGKLLANKLTKFRIRPRYSSYCRAHFHAAFNRHLSQ
ncbi:DUF3631 domain-containing protein [Aquipseudomonas ullengensis]|uniref:DUF3631 domain-containing protein n=1 Tax=Aquipseudomonas ullengensis TaxID=2759166 RepID=A0A7W4QBE1_9GAMM|nr:DUF3631 domain-containing protein [Pseudomonas ullengensis]MBB2496832.1 DUF3631 domain-containing protein [Pseudomonas ullengensis]